MIAKISRVGGLLMVAFLLAACSDDVTGPEGTGGMQAFMQDDGGEAASHASMASAQEGGSQSNQTHLGYSGSFNANTQVEISVDGQTWVELGPPATVSVGLQSTGGRTEVHGEVEVPVGTYSHVRLVLEGAHATLEAGSSIGLLTLDANVTMQIGGNGSVTVEKTVPPFQVTADSRTEVTWNLNSQLWVNQENTEEEEVEEEEFEEAPEPRTERYQREVG